MSDPVQSFRVEMAKISELKPHPRNYREHPDDQLQHLVESLKEHGVRDEEEIPKAAARRL